MRILRSSRKGMNPTTPSSFSYILKGLQPEMLPQALLEGA
jgi:hypothetical protein